MVSYKKLENELKENQSPARFRHSRAVGALAAALGQKYGWDPEEARLAGLLHDWAKEWPPTILVQYVKRFKVSVPDPAFILKVSPNLLHAYVSADVVRRKGWIRNKKALNAISSHTLGSLTMGRPEKILYTADFAAPDRTYPSAATVRSEVFEDLDRGFRSALSEKLQFQLKMNKPLHPMTVAVWNQWLGK